MTEKDALDKLILNEDENPNIDLLAEIILKYLRFTKHGEIIFEKDFYELKDWQKVLVYILGRKVIFIKKLQNDFDEKISYKEISKQLGLKESSVTKYASKELKGIIKSEKGKYFVPNYNLYKCKEKLNQDGRKTTKK